MSHSNNYSGLNSPQISLKRKVVCTICIISIIKKKKSISIVSAKLTTRNSFGIFVSKKSYWLKNIFKSEVNKSLDFLSGWFDVSFSFPQTIATFHDQPLHTFIFTHLFSESVQLLCMNNLSVLEVHPLSSEESKCLLSPE